MRTSIVSALAVLLVAACRPALPPAPAIEPGFSDGSDVPEPAGVEADAPAPFVFLPGDVVSIRVISLETTETTGLVVDESGAVSVPLLGAIVVGGLTMAQAQTVVEGRCHELDHYARAAILVTDPAGHKVVLTGAFEHPGTMPVKPGARLADILATAGGPKMRDIDGRSFDLADVSAARLVRDGVAMPISLTRAMRGEPRHNVRVRAGDVIFVPSAQGREITVLGSVKNAKVIPFSTGLRLSAALAMAGGNAREADEGDIRVIRGSLAAPRVYRASVTALVAGKGGDIQLQPGDVVYVTEHWLATTSDVVNKLTPALIGAALVTTLK